ncbi:hypothetical protein ACKI16_29415 [Streptomyces scabiei]|uniref:hypothetical protein n=1 Tax=Streptomyces scabiei TaxID=1930 RepID=UPI0038F6531E
MSTSGAYTPAAVPECPYAPRMTRAAALALRAAGGLRENCVVVLHTDTPTIGTAGNTSATEIELNPVSPTEFGTTARVHTTFAASAWQGVYDIDLGAAGSITELRDDFGNTAKDVDAGSATVHTQWPWHLGSTTLRDNYAEDAVLTAVAAQVGTITNCRFVGSTVDFTGKTAGTWTDSEFVGATVTTGANMVATRATVRGATVSNAGAGAFTLADSAITDASTVVTVSGAATGIKNFTGTTVRDKFRMNITGTGNVFLTGSEFIGRGSHTSEAELGGSSAVSITDTTVMPAFGAFAALDLQGAGTVTLSDGDMRESRVSVAAGASAAATVFASTFTFRRSGGIILTATATGPVSMVQGVFLAGGSIFQSGAAALQMNACQGNFSLIGAAAATRGATLTGLTGQQFTVTQNGTGSTNIDSVTQSEGFGTVAVNLNSTGAGTPAQTFTRLSLANGATLNVVDPAGAQPVDNCRIETQSTVNLQAGGSMSRCRVAGEATLNTGAFGHIATVVEIQGTTTLTAANVNRRRTKSFSDVI